MLMLYTIVEVYTLNIIRNYQWEKVQNIYFFSPGVLNINKNYLTLTNKISLKFGGYLEQYH